MKTIDPNKRILIVFNTLITATNVYALVPKVNKFLKDISTLLINPDIQKRKLEKNIKNIGMQNASKPPIIVPITKIFEEYILL